jgi:hypothetical protein
MSISEMPVQYLSLAILAVNIAQWITVLAKRGKSRMDKASEYAEQCAFVEWCEWNRGKYPELEMLMSIPLGGKRDEATGAMLKRSGTKAGYPDIALNVARGGYHGLFIELKTGKGKLSEAQRRWITKLRTQGNYAVVCFGADQAIAVTTEYLNGQVWSPKELLGRIGYKQRTPPEKEQP